jgi:hypothetical protein
MTRNRVSNPGEPTTKGRRVELISKKRLMLVAGRGNHALSEEIASCLNTPLGDVVLSTFANGEIYCRYGESIRGADVFIVQSHCGDINARIMEQLILIDAAKRASAKRITAVCPFYGYARQDRKAEGREPITARLLADLLTAAGCDRLVSVDLHTGQIQGFFNGPVDHLTAVHLLAEYVATQVSGDVVVVAPDAGAHPVGVDAVPQLRFGDGELAAVVHAERLGRILGHQRGDAVAGVTQHRDRVGQVVLALHVLGADAAQRRCQQRPTEAVDRRVHFGDEPLVVGGVRVLDDRFHLVVLSPHDAAVARRVVDDRGQQRCRGFLLTVDGREPRQRLGAQQRRVAGHQKNVVFVEELIREGGERDARRVTRAALHALLDELDGHRDRELIVQRLGDALGAVTDDHHDLGERQRGERGDDVQQHRTPAQRVQHLGGRGLHARAFARGEHDGGQRTVSRHRHRLLVQSRRGRLAGSVASGLAPGGGLEPPSIRHQKPAFCQLNYPGPFLRGGRHGENAVTVRPKHPFLQARPEGRADVWGATRRGRPGGRPSVENLGDRARALSALGTALPARLLQKLLVLLLPHALTALLDQ